MWPINCDNETRLHHGAQKLEEKKEEGDSPGRETLFAGGCKKLLRWNNRGWRKALRVQEKGKTSGEGKKKGVRVVQLTIPKWQNSQWVLVLFSIWGGAPQKDFHKWGPTEEKGFLTPLCWILFF